MTTDSSETTSPALPAARLPRLRLRLATLREGARRALRLGLWLAAIYGAVVGLLMLAYLFVPPVSTLMLARWVTVRPAERHWVALEDVSPQLIRAVMTSEDQPFCSHWGVDWPALLGEIDKGLEGRRTFGASTITMQTTKNLFLWSSRSYVRKAMEIPLATVLDVVWSKHRILEVYLNIAEWGPGIFGIEAAARYHFRKGARDLTTREAALLAASLPNPILRKPGRPSASLARKASLITERMSGTDVSCVAR